MGKQTGKCRQTHKAPDIKFKGGAKKKTVKQFDYFHSNGQFEFLIMEIPWTSSVQQTSHWKHVQTREKKILLKNIFLKN